MKGFVILTQEDDGIKVTDEGLTRAEVLTLLRKAARRYGIWLVRQAEAGMQAEESVAATPESIMMENRDPDSQETYDPRFEGSVFIVPGTDPTDDELETAKVECLQERQPDRWRRGEPIPGCALILRDKEGVVRALCAVDRAGSQGEGG